MAIFPGNIPLIQGAALIDFNDYDLEIVRVPATTHLGVWRNLEDLERRLALYRWALHIIRERGRSVWLMEDIARGFLYGFEATIQTLGDQIFGSDRSSGAKINNKLLKSPHYGLDTRGVRSLRHLEAHISLRANPDRLLTSEYGGDDYSGFASGSDSGRTVSWHFTPLSEDRRKLVKGLSSQDLANWNARIRTTPAREVMRNALLELLAFCWDIEENHPF